MAHTSQHHKDMKYFVGAEILMLRIEDRKLQRIDHTADGIDDTAGKEPSEACAGQIVEDRNKSKVNRRLKKKDHMMIFVMIAGSYTPVCLIVLHGRTGYILCALVWTVAIIGMILKGCWINCPKWLSSVIYIGMVKCACQVKKDHGKDKNTYCKNMENVCASGRLHDQRSGSGHGKKHADSVGYGTSRIF